MAKEIRTDDILEIFETDGNRSEKRERKPSSSSRSHSGKRKRKKRAHPWAFPLGLLIAVLSAIGLVCVIFAGIGTAKKAIIKVKNIDEYNKMLIPVVMNDPDTFDDLTKADMNQLLDISIWAILKSDLAPDTYTYNDSGMVIPEEDVSKQFTKLFGKNVAPVHASVTGFGYEFSYDAASKCYTIPLTGVAPVYTPDVIDVDKKGGAVILTVAYLSANGWTQSEDGKMVAPSPDKYVKITLREGDSGYYISALQAASAPETASASAVTEIAENTESAQNAQGAGNTSASDKTVTEVQTSIS